MRLNKKYKSLKKSIKLVVKTKCPEKWLLVDKETGQVYQGNVDGYWDRLDPVTRDS